MKSLAEFETLEAAKEYTQTRGKLIHRNTMNAWLSQANKYRRLKAIAEDETHVLGDGAAAFLDSTEYNLIQSSETGQGVIALMQALIAAEGNDAALQSVLDKAIAAANEVYCPHENATSADFARAKGQTGHSSPISQSGGFIRIETASDCEPHRPQIFAVIQGECVQVGTAPEISSQGVYMARVPANHSAYVVENYYGVIQ